MPRLPPPARCTGAGRDVTAFTIPECPLQSHGQWPLERPPMPDISSAGARLCEVLPGKRNVRPVRLESYIQQVAHQRHGAEGKIGQNVSDHPSLCVPGQVMLSQLLE